jgi:hypothetical protein
MPHAGSNEVSGHCLAMDVLRPWHVAHADGVEVILRAVKYEVFTEV